MIDRIQLSSSSGEQAYEFFCAAKRKLFVEVVVHPREIISDFWEKFWEAPERRRRFFLIFKVFAAPPCRVDKRLSSTTLIKTSAISTPRISAARCEEFFICRHLSHSGLLVRALALKTSWTTQIDWKENWS